MDQLCSLATFKCCSARSTTTLELLKIASCCSLMQASACDGCSLCLRVLLIYEWEEVVTNELLACLGSLPRLWRLALDFHPRFVGEVR